MTDIQRLEAKLDRLLEAIPTREYITMEDIGIMHGWSKSFMYHNQWTMPNFGRSDYPGRERRWLPETVGQWFMTPPEIRKRQWLRMSIRERSKLTA